MTVRELIQKTDDCFPNVYSFASKAGWLYDLDKKIYGEFLSRYKGTEFPDGERGLPVRELLLEEQFSDVYINYLCMQMELSSGNITGYQNRATLFNSHYLDFMNSFNRTHLIGQVRINME